MKHIKSLLTQLLVISTLMAPWATSAAQELSTQGLVVLPGKVNSTATVKTFDQSGVITKLGYDKFTVGDKSFRVAPGARLQSSDSSRSRFSDFKVGDEIYFKGKILDGVNYVDIIYYDSPESS